MKLIHLSDLHLGKRVNGFSQLEDQEYIFVQIVQIIDEEKPHCVVIAGDVYDKPVPSGEAVQLFDDFLYQLARRQIQVLVISGNHDSPERIAFGSRLMGQSGIHMAPVYSGKVSPISLQDEHGVLDIFMLPFVKPANVRSCYPEEEITSYTDAVSMAIHNMTINPAHRNILVTHQFVTGALRSESEDISVGGSDNVDASVFAPFDYVALGHIHRPQNIGSDTVRYCGTPLKYSFSEANHEKSVTIVEFAEKGSVLVRTSQLMPLRDLREIRGSYLELTARNTYENTDTDDYLHITLTDEEDIPNAISNLQVIYPNLMKLDYDNTRTKKNLTIEATDMVDSKTPLQLVCEFYENQNNRTMSNEQLKFCQQLIEKIWGDEYETD